MRALRWEEEWTQQILSRVLGVEVKQHDDGSEPGMYDLTILETDTPSGAVEVTSAADGESIALWRLMNDRDERWQVDGLEGGWSVSLEPSARGKRVWKELPSLLALMEEERITDLGRANDPLVEDIAEALGVVDLVQLGTEFPGSVYVTLSLPSERTGGAVPQTGTPLSRWMGDFLNAPDQADVRNKLGLSTLSERHCVVVVPGLSTVPFPVMDLLIREDAPAPQEAPELPNEVTAVWIFSTWSSGNGFRWSPTSGWEPFEKLDPSAQP
jgi:hypothetical protein